MEFAQHPDDAAAKTDTGHEDRAIGTAIEGIADRRFIGTTIGQIQGGTPITKGPAIDQRPTNHDDSRRGIAAEPIAAAISTSNRTGAPGRGEEAGSSDEPAGGEGIEDGIE